MQEVLAAKCCCTSPHNAAMNGYTRKLLVQSSSSHLVATCGAVVVTGNDAAVSAAELLDAARRLGAHQGGGLGQALGHNTLAIAAVAALVCIRKSSYRCRSA